MDKQERDKLRHAPDCFAPTRDLLIGLLDALDRAETERDLLERCIPTQDEIPHVVRVVRLKSERQTEADVDAAYRWLMRFDEASYALEKERSR